MPTIVAQLVATAASVLSTWSGMPLAGVVVDVRGSVRAGGRPVHAYRTGGVAQLLRLPASSPHDMLRPRFTFPPLGRASIGARRGGRVGGA